MKRVSNNNRAWVPTRDVLRRVGGWESTGEWGKTPGWRSKDAPCVPRAREFS